MMRNYFQVLIVGLLLFAPLALNAASGQGSVTAEYNSSPEFDPDTTEENRHDDLINIQLIGGFTTYLSGPSTSSGSSVESVESEGGAHGFYGGALHIRISGWGLLGRAEWGQGRGYESRMIGGAISREFITTGPLRLSLFGGVGDYSETGNTGIRRGTIAPLFGTVASLDLSPFLLSLYLSDLYGSYDGTDVTKSFDFHVPRLAIGLGL